MTANEAVIENQDKIIQEMLTAVADWDRDGEEK
jgi:hypothetical protein